VLGSNMSGEAHQGTFFVKSLSMGPRSHKQIIPFDESESKIIKSISKAKEALWPFEL